MSAVEGRREPAHDARLALAQIREKLREPSTGALEECAPLIEEAAQLLRRLQLSGERGEPANVEGESLHRVREDLGRVRRLLNQASRHYLGWARILASSSALYQADGVVRPGAGSSMLLQG